MQNAPACPNCGHRSFRAVGSPGRAACQACGQVSTHEEALMAGARLPGDVAMMPIRTEPVADVRA